MHLNILKSIYLLNFLYPVFEKWNVIKTVEVIIRQINSSAIIVIIIVSPGYCNAKVSMHLATNE
jgi:hypothetical protein